MGDFFLNISPVTGLGLCEHRELCERLILSYVRAVLLDKAGLKSRRALMDVFTLRPCASAGKQQVVLDFFEISWSVIVRSGLFGKLTEQTELSRAEAQGHRAFCNRSVLVHRHLRTTRRSSLPRAKSKSNAPYIDQCLPR